MACSIAQSPTTANAHPRDLRCTNPGRGWPTQLCVAASIIGGLLLTSPAKSADTMPGPVGQEILIRTTLLTFNDANVTGNYAVLHAKLAKPLRDEVTPDRLKQAFKGFVDQKIDLGIVAANPPIATSKAQIDERGVLLLRGAFDGTSSRINYKLDFVPSEGEWKPVKLSVNVDPLVGQ